MSKKSVFLIVGGVAVTMLVGCQSLAASKGSSAAPASLIGSADQRLEVGQSVRGELTTRSNLNPKDGSRYETFVMSVTDGDLVEINVDGSLSGLVSLYNDQDELVQTGAPLRYRAEDGGDYVVVVSGMDATSYGPFNVSSSTIELNQTSTLVGESSATGWMQGGEDVYTLTIEEAGAYQIDLRSDEFDTLVKLSGPNGYYTENDDGGDDYNARIGDLLEPGDYQLKAGSYQASSGLYTVQVSKLDIEIDDNRDITAPANVNGWMRTDSEVYTLTIEQGGVYQIDMRSDTLDSVLTLEGPDGDIFEDDDGGDGYNSRIRQSLKPGVYYITASSYGDSGGLFTLTVNRR